MEWVPAVEDVAMPELAFEETQEDVDNYEKYYYFNRPETDFATALGDLRECDAHARGLFRGDHYPDPGIAAMYGIGGVAGGLIGGAIADAIYGSAEVRLKRRVNMRRCMFYKGYARYGLDKGSWEKFNFEEGNSGIAEPDRQRMLMLQARAASGPRPQAKELGL
jgi:hypothetical protein